MPDNNHPMLPTQEQLTEWDSERFDEGENFDVMMIKAFQAGADQELEACISAILAHPGFEHPELFVEVLRAARRPKPPSLKKQALKELAWVDKNLNMPLLNQCDAIHTIHRAIEALPD